MIKKAIKDPLPKILNHEKSFNKFSDFWFYPDFPAEKVNITIKYRKINIDNKIVINSEYPKYLVMNPPKSIT